MIDDIKEKLVSNRISKRIKKRVIYLRNSAKLTQEEIANTLLISRSSVLNVIKKWTKETR